MRQCFQMLDKDSIWGSVTLTRRIFQKEGHFALLGLKKENFSDFSVPKKKKITDQIESNTFD